MKKGGGEPPLESLSRRVHTSAGSGLRLVRIP